MRASENITEYITDAKKPVSGKAYKLISFDPNNAANKDKIAPHVKKINTFLLSNNFKSINPRKQPIVSKPQKYEITEAPVVAGST